MGREKEKKQQKAAHRFWGGEERCWGREEGGRVPWSPEAGRRVDSARPLSKGERGREHRHLQEERKVLEVPPSHHLGEKQPLCLGTLGREGTAASLTKDSFNREKKGSLLRKRGGKKKEPGFRNGERTCGCTHRKEKNAPTFRD